MSKGWRFADSAETVMFLSYGGQKFHVIAKEKKIFWPILDDYDTATHHTACCVATHIRACGFCTLRGSGSWMPHQVIQLELRRNRCAIPCVSSHSHTDDRMFLRLKPRDPNEWVCLHFLCLFSTETTILASNVKTRITHYAARCVVVY